MRFRTQINVDSLKELCGATYELEFSDVRRIEMLFLCMITPVPWDEYSLVQPYIAAMELGDGIELNMRKRTGPSHCADFRDLLLYLHKHSCDALLFEHVTMRISDKHLNDLDLSHLATEERHGV